MPFYERGQVRIHYEEVGSGFPLLVIPGGGLNSTVAGLATHPFNPFDEFKGEFRVIAADLRNAKGGQSSGPFEVDRPWDAYTDDHIGLMDHLGIREFMVLGFCIGGPFVWNLLQRAGDRVVAAVPAQPSGYRPEMPDLSYNNNMKGWGPDLCARRPDITMAMVDTFLTNMYRARADFVYTVSRDFVRNCQTPILVLPDDVPAHPYAVAMECVHLAPNAQVSLYPWKDTPDKIPLAVRHIRSFPAPIDLLQQRNPWQPPPSSVAPIPDLPALTPERGSSTVSGTSARRYKIQTPVTPGLFRVPVRKRARQAVTALGDDEAGGPEHRTFDLALDQKRDYRTLSSNTGKRRWCLANPPFVDRGGGLRPRPLGGRPRTGQQPRLIHPSVQAYN